MQKYVGHNIWTYVYIHGFLILCKLLAQEKTRTSNFLHDDEAFVYALHLTYILLLIRFCSYYRQQVCRKLQRMKEIVRKIRSTGQSGLIMCCSVVLVGAPCSFLDEEKVGSCKNLMHSISLNT